MSLYLAIKRYKFVKKNYSVAKTKNNRIAGCKLANARKLGIFTFYLFLFHGRKKKKQLRNVNAEFCKLAIMREKSLNYEIKSKQVSIISKPVNTPGYSVTANSMPLNLRCLFLIFSYHCPCSWVEQTVWMRMLGVKATELDDVTTVESPTSH